MVPNCFRRFWRPGTKTPIIIIIIYVICLCSFLAWVLYELISHPDGFILFLVSLIRTHLHPFLSRSATCTSPVNSSQDYSSANIFDFEEKWRVTIETTSVQQFRTSYLGNCANFGGTYTIDIEYESPRHLPKSKRISRGLANALRVVVMSFVFAQFLEPPRRFYLIANQWNYGAFNKTFQDFSTNSACPISSFVPPNANKDAKVSMEWNGDVAVDDNNVLYEFSVQPIDVGHYDAYQAPSLRWGAPKYFETMSVTARAFLSPNQNIRQTIQSLWEYLTKQKTTYAFVHVRRGDKHTEAKLVPISEYIEKLNTESTRKNNSVTTVFLMCDGDTTCGEFSAALGGSYRLVTYKKWMVESGLWNSSRRMEEHTQASFDKLPEEDRLAQTVELVVSLYIAALSDFIVCTYSSNICKLIAVLRGGVMDHNDIYSVDEPSWDSTKMTVYHSLRSLFRLPC